MILLIDRDQTRPTSGSSPTFTCGTRPGFGTDRNHQAKRRPIINHLEQPRRAHDLHMRWLFLPSQASETLRCRGQIDVLPGAIRQSLVSAGNLSSLHPRVPAAAPRQSGSWLASLTDEIGKQSWLYRADQSMTPADHALGEVTWDVCSQAPTSSPNPPATKCQPSLRERAAETATHSDSRRASMPQPEVTPMTRRN